ncbi:hypothetical protein AC578_10218 [Pseudocercospora eumusae]|uniref:DUF6604 domain-containing protein n=1 Tax=Pseudocercospora eumusae TaxID=321146 RepID=A0A139HYL4_9PEZI|nr:hypothetical protein AC578_10218 [Pseudocercospora eumusae]
MEDDPVRYLHARYKTGTNAVVDWLATTARQRCDIAKVLRLETSAGQNEAAKPNRSSKKARNKKGKAHDGQTLHVELSTAELRQLGLEITATASPTTKAPEGLENALKLLEDVVRGRRECAKWHNDGEDGHRHFIDTMDQILQDLRGARWARHKDRQATDSRKPRDQLHDAPSISNTFAGLAIEQPSTAPLGHMPTRPQRNRDQLPKNTSFTLREDAEVEKRFAVWCFFKQSQDIRELVKSVWQEYLKGQFVLQNAAQMTFVAANLIKDSSIQLSEKYPDLANVEDLLRYLRIKYHISDGVPTYIECRALRGKEEFDIDQLSDLFCVRGFVGGLLLKRWYSSAKGSPEQHIEACMHTHCYHPVLQSYIELAPDLNDIFGGKGLAGLGYVDIFLLNLGDLALDYKTSTAAAMVLETQMCVSDILGPARQHVHVVLRDIAEHVEMSLGYIKGISWQTCEDGAELFPVGLTEAEDDLRQNITKAVPLKQSSYAARAELETTGVDSKYVLARLPLTAGLVSMKLQTYFHTRICPAANSLWLIQSMAHLYRALRDAGLISAVWKDMEFVVEAQGLSTLGLREASDAPWSFLQAAKNYGLAFGVSALDFAKKRRRQGNNGLRVRLPQISVHPTSEQGVVRPRIENQPNMVLASSITETLWSAGTDRVCLGRTATGTTQGNLHKFVSSLMTNSAFPIEDEIKTQWSSTKQLTPIQLLHLTKQSLDASELAMNFNYLRLYEGCSIVFSTILENNAEAVSSSQSAEGLKESQNPREVIDELLWGAAIEEMRLPRPPKACGLTHILDIATYLEAWIKKNGDWCYDEAFFMTSGNLADDLIPEKNISSERKLDSRGLLQKLENGVLEISTTIPGVSLHEAYHNLEKPRSEEEKAEKILENVQRTPEGNAEAVD